MDNKDQNISVEWVLIALLSVFALSSAISIFISFGVIMFQTGMSPYDLISMGFFVGPIKGTVYWLVGVGALWFIAHRLWVCHWWVLVIIGVAVSIGMMAAFSGTYFSLFWLVVNAAVSAIMGWVLWRLAYRSVVLDATPRPKLGGYETTIGRALAALLSGGLVGIGATMVIAMAVFGGMRPEDFVEIGGFVTVFWLGGVFVLGGASFAALHFIGLRQWYGMTIVGGVIMLVLGIVLFEAVVEIKITLTMAIAGSIVGWVIWRVAYRRPPVEG